MSLPHASQHQIDAMNKIAEDKMKQDGVLETPVVPGQTSIMNPMLQYHQESEEVYDDQDEEQEDQVLEEPIPVSAHDKASNLRILAAAKEKAERERDEMMRQILMYQKQEQKPVMPVEPEDDPFSQLGLDDESLVEGKHLKEMVKEIKNLKNSLKKYQTQSTQTAQDAIDMKLRSQYPDIDKVLTAENIESFRNFDPDLAETINNNQDIYKKASMAYKLIKQYGIYKENSFDGERAIAHKNAAKPKPLASVSPQQGESPMSKANAFANGLTPDLKKQLHKEMLDAMKGR